MHDEGPRRHPIPLPGIDYLNEPYTPTWPSVQVQQIIRGCVAAHPGWDFLMIIEQMAVEGVQVSDDEVRTVLLGG